MPKLLKLHWLAILVGTTGLLLSAAAFWAIGTEIEKRHQLEFEWLAQNRNRVIQRGIKEVLDAVHTLHDLFSVFPQVDEQAFATFGHGLFERFKGIHALAWVPRLKAGVETATVALHPSGGSDREMSSIGQDGYEPGGPAIRGEDRFPIHYLVSERESACLKGQDLGAQPELRALMTRGMGSADLVVSGRILLSHGPNPQYGFMALMPVFGACDSPAPEPCHHADLLGFVAGIFRIADIADAAMGLLEPRGVEFLVLDESARPGEELLDFYASRLNREPSTASTEWRGWDLDPAPRVTESFSVGDRRWSITCSPTRQFTTEVFWEGPWIVLGSGLALTLVIVMFISHFLAALRLRLRIEEELLASEQQKLRILFDQSPDIIMTVDREGSVLIVNRPQAGEDERRLGRSGASFLPARARERFTQALDKVLSLGEPESFGYAGDDSTWWELRLVPLREGSDLATAMVILTNVTEKRVLEAHAIRNARLASLGVLAASVAHEINNPNNAIQFNAAILARSWADIGKVLEQHGRDYGDFTIGGVPLNKAIKGLPRLLEGIIKGAHRIEKIVGNLKHMARPDAGDLDHAVDLMEILHTALSILQSQIQKYTDHCRLVLPESLPRVRGNGQQLEQVFINLILNALQSLPNRQAGVLITAGLEPEGEFVRVHVADEGRGMAAEVRKRVTEPFFTTRVEAGGTGLGLSICARIIQHHAGRLEIESQPGHGTKVSVLLPLAAAGD